MTSFHDPGDAVSRTPDALALECRLDEGWINRLFERRGSFGYYISKYPKFMNYILGKTSAFEWLRTMFLRAELAPFLQSILAAGGAGEGRARSRLSEVYQLIESEGGRKEVLLSRLRDIRAGLIGAGRYFDSIAPGCGRRPLLPPGRTLGGKFVAIRGNLIDVELAGTWNTDIKAALSGSGIRWILSDYPPFLLADETAGCRDDFVCIAVDDDDLDELEQVPPFDRKIGWHPYVEVSGYFSPALSMAYRNPKLDLGYFFLRAPVKPEHGCKILLDADAPVSRRPGCYDLSRAADREAVLLVTQILYRFHHMNNGNIRRPLRMIIDQIIAAHVHELPPRLVDLYKSP